MVNQLQGHLEINSILYLPFPGLSTKCKLSAIRSLQHALLLLEKNKRQQLQLLLRFMMKIARNQVLNLSNDLPTRELVSLFITVYDNFNLFHTLRPVF